MERIIKQKSDRVNEAHLSMAQERQRVHRTHSPNQLQSAYTMGRQLSGFSSPTVHTGTARDGHGNGDADPDDADESVWDSAIDFIERHELATRCHCRRNNQWDLTDPRSAAHKVGFQSGIPCVIVQCFATGF
jgi:hypothetical protein